MEFKLSLWSFCIKLEGWGEMVFVDLREGRCRVLTGINAGGKTITLRALEDFCNILKEPSESKFRDFERLARSAGIESISARFGYRFYKKDEGVSGLGVENLLPWFELDLENFDWVTYDERFGVPNPGERDSPPIDATEEELDDWDWEEYGQWLGPDSIIGHVVLDRAFYLGNMDNSEDCMWPDDVPLPHDAPDLDDSGYKHLWWVRDGMLFEVFERDLGTFQHELFGEPGTSLGSHPPNLSLRSFGPVILKDSQGDWLHGFHTITQWTNELAESTGITFSINQHYGENYYFEDAGLLPRFEIMCPEMMDVSEAYHLEANRITDLEKISNKWSDHSNANDLLKTAYLKVQSDFSSTSDPRFNIFKQNPELLFASIAKEMRKIEPELAEDLREYPLLSNETNTRREQLENLQILARWINIPFSIGDPPHSTDDEDSDEVHQFKLQLMEKLGWMSANSQFWGDEKGVNSLPEEAGKRGVLETDDGSHIPFNEVVPMVNENDWQPGRYEQIPVHWKNQMSSVDRDFRFWISLMRFGDFSSNSYLSSGQRRLLSIMSRLVDSSDGSTILIDEPELSLHIDWQAKLISAISEALPQCNLLIATHSPSIIQDHVEKVVSVPPEGGG